MDNKSLSHTKWKCQYHIVFIPKYRKKIVTVHRQAFSELKMPYDTVVAADFADLKCEASAKSVTGTRYE